MINATTAPRRLGQRTAVRTIVLAACLVLLALSTAQRASANESGPAVDDPATNMINLCRALGGTAIVDSYRTPSARSVVVGCKGGLLDGLWCTYHTQLGTSCVFAYSPPVEEPRVPPTGGIDVPEDMAPVRHGDPVGEISDGGVVAPSEPTPPVAEPVREPVANPVAAPLEESVSKPVEAEVEVPAPVAEVIETSVTAAVEAPVAEVVDEQP